MSDKHECQRDDLAAYLLGALSAEEATALEHHLENCESCREEMRWLGPAVRTLPESVDRRQPPPKLRQRVMAEVRADARRARAEVDPRGLRATAADWLDRIGAGSLGLKPIAAMLVAALLVVAFAGYEIGLNDESDGGAPKVLTSQQPSGIKVAMTREGEGATLRLANVRQIPDNHVLEAWVRRGGTVEPVPALFVPNDEGRATTTIDDLSGVDTVLVTTEPKGGSKSPTSAPIVTMSVPQ